MAEPNIKHAQFLSEAHEDQRERFRNLFWDFMVWVYGQHVSSLNEQGFEWLQQTCNGRRDYPESLLVYAPDEAVDSFMEQSLQALREAGLKVVWSSLDSLRAKGISAEHFSPPLVAQPEVEE